MKNTALILIGLLWACLGLAIGNAAQIVIDLYDGFTIGATAIASVILFLYALDLES